MSLRGNNSILAELEWDEGLSMPVANTENKQLEEEVGDGLTRSSSTVSVFASLCLSPCLSVCLPVCLPACLSVCLSVSLARSLPCKPSSFISDTLVF